MDYSSHHTENRCQGLLEDLLLVSTKIKSLIPECIKVALLFYLRAVTILWSCISFPYLQLPSQPSNLASSSLWHGLYINRHQLMYPEGGKMQSVNQIIMYQQERKWPVKYAAIFRQNWLYKLQACNIFHCLLSTTLMEDLPGWLIEEGHGAGKVNTFVTPEMPRNRTKVSAVQSVTPQVYSKTWVSGNAWWDSRALPDT